MNKVYETIVADICWDKNTNIDETKLRLMQHYSKEDIDEAHEYAHILLQKLHDIGIDDKMAEIQGYYGDSVHDCLCELVAHGERFFNMIMEKPEMALKMFECRQYTENFLYVFPSDEDFKMLSHSYHREQVGPLLAELDEIRSSLLAKYNPDWLKKEGGYDCDMAEDVLKEVHAGIKNEKRVYGEIYAATENLGHHALYANVWSDFMKFSVTD